jgi:DNA-directed RNA polymerase subunit RPC12/RpoP
MDDPYKRIFNILVDKDADLSGVRSNDLLGCPFCGSEVYHESTITEEVIRCTLCPAKMVYDGSFEALKVMWNHRAT